MLVMVGWRGEPGCEDEPQHVKQGQVQCDLLRALGVPYAILSDSDMDVEEKVILAHRMAEWESRPYVFLVRKGTFESEPWAATEKTTGFTRESALKILVEQLKIVAGPTHFGYPTCDATTGPLVRTSVGEEPRRFHATVFHRHRDPRPQVTEG